MKRTVKYSSIIVAALLAAAPVAMNHSSLVKAAETPAPVIGQEGNQNKGDQQNSSAEKKDDAKGTDKQEQGTAVGSNQGNKRTDAEPWENAQEVRITQENAPEVIRIKWNSNLTENGFYNYIKKQFSKEYLHLYVGDTEKPKMSNIWFHDEFLNKNGKLIRNDTNTKYHGIRYNGKINPHAAPNQDPYLEPGDYLIVNRIEFSPNLDVSQFESNTWYKWTTTFDVFSHKYVSSEDSSDINKEIPSFDTERVHVEVKNDAGQKHLIMYEKTYDGGILPNTIIYDLKPCTFQISTDSDALDISAYEEDEPKNSGNDKPANSDNTESNTGNNDSDNNNDNYVPSNDDDVTPTAPATDNSQKSTPARTDDSKKGQKPVKNNSAKNNASTSSSNKAVVQAPTYTVKHTALVYDRHGKRVKTSAKRFILKRKNGKIKVLDHGKVYKIRGKKYYRIGKNMFIKAANVSVQAPAKKVDLKGTAKVAKLRHLKFYNANGKHIKKTAKKRNFRFDRKKTIKGKLYYRVKGTNLWVRANQFKLHK